MNNGSIIKPSSLMPPPMRRWPFMLAGVLLTIAVIVIFIFTQQFLSWDFRNNLWGPTHLLVTGRSPYLIEQLFDGSNSVWMPTVIGAFLPLGMLSQSLATNIWAVSNILLYCGLIAWSIPTGRPHPLWLGVALLGLFIFPSFASVVLIGQFGIWAVFLMLLAARQITPRRILLAGLLVALASAKPQLILLPVMGLMVGFYRRYSYRATVQFLLAAAGISLLLTLPLWAGYPAWLEGFKIALGRNPPWMQPSAFVLLPALLGIAGILIWAVMAIVAIGVNYRLWSRLPPNYAMSWSLALNLLVSPYMWSWDFVLLVPLFLQIFFRLQKWWMKTALIVAYGIGVYLMIMVRITSDNNDWKFWWFPWLLMITMVVLVVADRRYAVETSPVNT